MPDPILIGLPQINYVWPVRIAFAEKGVPDTLIPAAPRTAEVDAIHPLGRIPVLRHGVVTLFESRAICTYIDRAFDGPPLWPADALAAARAEAWLSLVQTTIEPVLIRRYVFAYLFPGTTDGAPDRARIDAAWPEVERYLDLLEVAVANDWLGGAEFSLADAFLAPILHYLRALPETGPVIERWAALTRYLNTALARPSVRDTVPPPLPRG